MTLTLTLGWWLVPLVITIIAMFIAFWVIPESSGRAYDFSPIIGCATIPLGMCVSLLAWLVWALLR